MPREARFLIFEADGSFRAWFAQEVTAVGDVPIPLPDALMGEGVTETLAIADLCLKVEDPGGDKNGPD